MNPVDLPPYFENPSDLYDELPVADDFLYDE